MTDRSLKTPATTMERERLWAGIRHDFEHTTAPVRLLARRWGISSENSIRRRRDREGWVRDMATITADMVTTAVLGENDTPIDGVATQETAAEIMNDINDKFGKYVDRPNEDPTHPTPPPRRDPTDPTDTTLRSDREAAKQRTVARVTSLANIQAAAIREQIAIGQDMAEVGANILRHLSMALSIENPVQRMDAQRALLSINPDKDTMAGLAAAALKLVDGGTLIKRRALGMDRIKTPQPDPSASGNEIRRVLTRLSTEDLMALRRVATNIGRLPKVSDQDEDTIEGGAVQ